VRGHGGIMVATDNPGRHDPCRPGRYRRALGRVPAGHRRQDRHGRTRTTTSEIHRYRGLRRPDAPGRPTLGRAVITCATPG